VTAAARPDGTVRCGTDDGFGAAARFGAVACFGAAASSGAAH